MNFTINRNLLEQTTFTSAVPSGLACVVHTVAQEGEHELHVLGDSHQVADRMHLHVARARPVGAPPAAHLAVDPVALAGAQLRRGPSEPPAHQVIQPGAYLTISTPAARDARRVRLVRSSDGAVVFDSDKLGAGDRFAVTLIRPGRYQVENQLDGATLALTVEYPVIGRQPYRPPEPLQIECTAGGFQAPSTAIKPAQGVVFLCTTPARLQLALVQPDDGPHGSPPPRRPPPTSPATSPGERLTDEARAILRKVLRTLGGR